jgi:hypothetical protein
MMPIYALGFCTFCGKDLGDAKYCPSCGKKSDIVAVRPTGITVLGILHVVTGIILSIGAVMVGVISSMMPSMDYFGTMMSAVGGAITALLIVVAVLAFLIAAALFSGKKWGRTIVIVFSIINVVIQGMSIMGGNLFGFANVGLSCIVLYYMWRPHIISYFNR